jgi:hypothetical protein
MNDSREFSEANFVKWAYSNWSLRKALVSDPEMAEKLQLVQPLPFSNKYDRIQRRFVLHGDMYVRAMSPGTCLVMFVSDYLYLFIASTK